METNQIKKFAIEARNILKTGVLNKITSLGFDAHGKVEEKNKPLKVQPGAIFMGTHIADDTFYDKWISLYERVQQKGVKEICEEAAYTWFNRLMAIRIMQKNGFISPILAYESEIVHIPHIVAEARRGILPTMTEDNRRALLEYMEDDNKVTEQFTYLIIAFCQFNPVLKACFGNVNDYTELLLPKNILAEGGFIDLLNHTDFISDEDYCSPELIGWLYQFYISEKKDEVFASFKKSKKAEAEDIPAATQIFTPNWIVKYMVQNTIGRIYLDNNPYSSLAEQMKYLVEPSEPTPQEAKLVISDIETMKMIDPACGSGHILIEAFDLFYQMYQEEGYSRRQAVEAILTKNLLGIDLDTRAKQLAMFALLMAACKKDTYFLEANILPQVLDMSGIPVLYDRIKNDLSDILLTKDNKVLNELMDAMKLLQQADNLGSIMKFDISEVTREIIVRRLAEYKTMGEMPIMIRNFLSAFRLLLALTDKYAAVVANPPYMGAGNMNAELAKYVNNNYADGKSDLMTVFMIICQSLTINKGKYAMINLPSWLFLSSFEKLRKNIIKNYHIDSLLHLGRGIFGIDWGSTAFTITNGQSNHRGIYFRLHERNFQHIYYYHIGQLFSKVLKEPTFKYDFSTYRDEEVTSINIFNFQYSKNGLQLYFEVSQQDFGKIPGNPIAYWVRDKIIKSFNNEMVDEISKPSKGMMPGGDYLRFYWEISKNNIATNIHNHEQSKESNLKWYLYFKGGPFRRWAGNLIYVVDYQNDGKRVKTGDRNPSLYFNDNINWSKISSGKYSARIGRIGGLYDDAACQCKVFNTANYNYLLGFLNSKIAQEQLWCQSQTFNYTSSEVGSCSIIIQDNISKTVYNIVSQNILISKHDWDSHEISWDFQQNDLIFLTDYIKQNLSVESLTALCNTTTHQDTLALQSDESPRKIRLQDLMERYHRKWTTLFMQLHTNEEELNRQFIEIYGLQDELTPDVPLEEITILQQGEITIKDNEITFNADVIMKQFISYAVGCWMGRYRLDRPGLQIAHPNPTEEETAPYPYNGEEFTIDDDAIIPFMSRDCAFDDNAVSRFTDFVRITFGAETLTENLNFIEESLGKTLEDYFVKDFWKDHKKMYQNRPIYWLFSSKKGAFQCITYMHRMDAYTVEKIRSKYLLPHIEYLSNRILEMDNRAASLSTQERKKLDKLRKDLDECQEYHNRLHIIADEQIAFDLDDGVLVNHAKLRDVVAKIK
jgi:hypothetical protein